MCDEEKNTENGFKDANELEDMIRFVKNNRTYYTTRIEAMDARRKGDRIYYSEKERAYYIRRIKKPFWGW